MNRKTYWGIAALIVVLIAAGGFIFYQLLTVQQMKEQLAEERKLLEEREKPVAENKPPAAREGFKMVPHGDHWHEVPMDAPDVWQGEPHEPIVQPVQATQEYKEYTGPLTFHKELLETHPVEALRQQAREAGHWSADHIPPFPPDDTEAAEFARELYLFRYYRWTGQKDHPDFLKVLFAQREIFKAIAGRDDKTPWELARSNDLMKLVWPDLTGEPLTDIRYRTTFTEGINPLTARPLHPVELEMSNLGTTENR